MKRIAHIFLTSIICSLLCFACDDIESTDGSSSEYKSLLINQYDNVIIPSMIAYQSTLSDLKIATSTFVNTTNNGNFSNLKAAYDSAYFAYQRAVVNNYKSSENLEQISNIFKIDTNKANSYITNRNYNFNDVFSQKDANGFPIMDFMIFKPSDPISYFNADPKRKDFLDTLAKSMSANMDNILANWSTLRGEFTSSGGTNIGSSISTQLNRSLIYYEKMIREEKVGIPIGKKKPGDSFAADTTEIEAYYRSVNDGNEAFTLALLKQAIMGIENIYLGRSLTGNNEQGYDDILNSLGKSGINTDIKQQFTDIYTEINSRTSISGDEELYNKVQGIITLFKTDLLTALNVQDTDSANDGD
ncbi:MAG: imelysin family protein [Cyclobacteriaceae bacterium]